MKTKLYLTLIFLIMSLVGHAQPGEIDNSFNSSGTGAYGGTATLPTVDGSQDGIVYKTDVYPSSSVHKDKIMIIGRFSSYNGVQRKKIARINADGTLDTTFNTPYFSTNPASDYLYCVKVLPDNKILIGGSFSIGVYRNIARLNEDGTIDNTFNVVTPATAVRGTNGPVHAICLQSDNRILIGGDYTTFNSAGNRRLLRLNADGSLDATFNTVGTPNGEIRAIALQKLGANANKILVGGFFDGWTGQAAKGHLIRVLPNGDFDTTFNPGGTGVTGGSAVFDIIVKPDSDSFFAVGKFTGFNGTSRNSIVFLKKDAELLINTVGTGNGFTIFSAKFQPDGKVLIGGNFTSYGGATIPKGITRISATDATRDTSFLTGAGFNGGTGVYEGVSVIRDIVLQSDGKIIVSGDYTTYDATPRRMISRIKTRECPYSAVYDNGAWKDGIAIDASTTNYYMSISSGTYTVPTGSNFNACELEVKDGATLIIQPNASLTVNGIVMNNGTFTIESTGSLVQIKEDTKNADLGAGTFTMKRDVTQLKPFDFVYYSSPVEDQLLHDVSPSTRFDKFYKFNTSSNAWQVITDGLETMVEAKGYIARAGTVITAPNSTFNAAFVGRPHNGKVTIPMVRSGANDMNLVGNPYPSAIDANLFLSESSSNNANISPIIYLWSHATPIAASGNLYAYSSSDYIAYNKVGGVMTNPTGVPFQGKIAAGQAFFVKAVNPVNAVFTNTMRLTNNNAQFYKNASTIQDSNNRIWLDLTNEQGAFKQTLIGFSEGATNGIDRAYDGIGINGNSFVNFYSIVDSNKLVIQGRALPFDANQAVPLGYSTTVAGTFKISLHQFDGLFQNQNVYLLDKLTNTVQDIKTNGYTFNTEVGTFDNRFELKFTNAALGTKNAAMADQSAVVFAENHTISIQSTESINSVAVYDLTGKLLYTKNGIESDSFSTDAINASNQVLMVQITFSNDATLTKKVLVN
ncbi:hypothetical protein FNO01nite_09100 [Flavobacterium noncentrifugens]|uniref:Delta-60 repeat domain-containing protein n=1 Tax=Flavobacterium noncentrifugens TaxID=1128970 RepID=A0A1G8TIF0_9FLAO|nr:T9SS sorting signal type C domain-containing protein [Flavobacterium noncentrifugens]GEP50238.1 hypothetical protein FNO01nite_09100 [Flavobacterium noncentrifugens]SDJ41177.1 delta-60 repeat domain-containing protein [Flavobacterium noncentrifugens]